ncbi:MAG: hypothetical protein GAK29_03638 [Acinetobacter bereziniae]|jgi:hypothetical protein|uniref:Uncharacterized protein n=1 Tax=Acinetobacter bereziniae TaxID=106648 RepID=A0A833PCW0_ACIBZ|nr:MAG: hypothetical protein GAK29_03638 [Acinetobacter bereziniae]
MNICIGGPWNGSRLLGSMGHKKSFKVKGTVPDLITVYIKKKIEVKNSIYIFWVSDELMDIDANEIINTYLYKAG